MGDLNWDVKYKMLAFLKEKEHLLSKNLKEISFNGEGKNLPIYLPHNFATKGKPKLTEDTLQSLFFEQVKIH